MANSAAICALGVVLFPTSLIAPLNFNDPSDNFRAFVGTEFTGYFHYGFAALFFLILALMSMVNFRRTRNPKQFGKMPSHPIYLWCGIIMLACMIVLFAIFILITMGRNMHWVNEYCITYWLEAVMLTAFGFSWLRKGKINELVAKKKTGSTTLRQAN